MCLKPLNEWLTLSKFSKGCVFIVTLLMGKSKSEKRDSGSSFSELLHIESIHYSFYRLKLKDEEGMKSHPRDSIMLITTFTQYIYLHLEQYFPYKNTQRMHV